MQNHYDLLGIPPDAPLSAVHEAYEMQRRHAEWRGAADPALLAQYDVAWRVLSDPVSRRAYDQEIAFGRPAPYGPRETVTATAGRPPGRSECRLCGSAPAAPGRLRSHQGIILLMRFRHLDGPFCRDCGLAVFRDMTARTLFQGWWGFASFFITIGTVVKNAFLGRRFASLAAPRRDPAVQAPYDRPLDPGKPLLLRAAALGLLVPLVVLGIVVVGIRGDQPDAQVGKCVKISGSDAKLVSCSEQHDGQVISIADNLKQCPREAAGAVTRKQDNGKVLCVVTGR
jgi:hypothetical protein